MAYKEYKKLQGAIDYDTDAVDELADALNEINELDARKAQLKNLVDENPELHEFVWRTADGSVYALHNLDVDHLSNIMMHLLRRGEAIPRAIRSVAIKQGLTIPASVPLDWSEETTRRLSSAIDREDLI